MLAYAFVSSKAWLLRPDWLSDGFLLWKKHDFVRDFCLPLPTIDLKGFTGKEALYPDAGRMLRLIMSSMHFGQRGGPLSSEA